MSIFTVKGTKLIPLAKLVPEAEFVQSTVYILNDVMRKALESERIEQIGCHYPKGNKLKQWEANRYFRIKGVENTVLLREKNGYCNIISETVCCGDKEVNAVRELEKYHFTLNNGYIKNSSKNSSQNSSQNSSGYKQRYLSRMIANLIINGNIQADIANTLVVHHKTLRSLNMRETISIVENTVHRNFHNGVSSDFYGEGGNAESHGQTIVIRTIEEFDELVKYIAKVKWDYGPKHM